MKRNFLRAFQNQAHVVTVILRQTKIRHGDTKAALQHAVLIKDRSGNTGAMAIPLAISSRKSFFPDAHDFLSQKLHINFRSCFVNPAKQLLSLLLFAECHQNSSGVAYPENVTDTDLTGHTDCLAAGYLLNANTADPVSDKNMHSLVCEMRNSISPCSLAPASVFLWTAAPEPVPE